MEYDSLLGIAEWPVWYVGFFNYVSVGDPGIPHSEAGYDYLFLPTQYKRVVLPAY
jgi:hypothetical protein